MENKKQLIIIPPMSEPLQKLNEVLNGIAEDEKIEISIIDDLKELSQFIGSAGQCLVAFSNAKKCATFLQENRFVVAKTHTKVILLTPKEIPAKTLIKFTKIGLTESILENSPPKTLLYKVKLLLRSIKTSTGGEDKELAVKTMGEAGQAQTQAKEETANDKNETEETSVNYLAEERAKFKKNDADNGEALNYGENLKGKTSIQEEAIETHWKSKRKKDDSLTLDSETDASKVQSEDPSEIDMYYRGKKKTNELDIIEGDDMHSRKKGDQPLEEEDLYARKIDSTELDLTPGEEEKRRKFEEEESDYDYKKAKPAYELEAAEDHRPKPKFTEEEEEERKRKELQELEALFEEAKKRQEESNVEDLGGHYKGKISNIQMDFEEPEATQEKEDYDNSDLYSKEKPLDLDLIDSPEEKKRRFEEESESEKRKNEGFTENIDTDAAKGDSSTDHIETYMKSDINTNRLDNHSEDTTSEEKKTKAFTEEYEKERSKEDLPLSAAEDFFKKQAVKQDEEEDEEKEKSIDLDLLSADETRQKQEKRTDDEEESDKSKDISKLDLIDGNLGTRKSERQEEDDGFGRKKVDLVEKNNENERDRSANSKVDKIDTYYRSGENKKKDHDWDLNERKKNLDLGLEKAAAKTPENIHKKESKDLGEQTIDYRKMKEEFEAIARGESIDGDSFSGDGHGVLSGGREHDGDSFKVVEVEAVGFDFAINVLNMIYQKEVKAEEFYKAIAEELEKHYHAYPIFYTYKSSDQKHTEVFDSIVKTPLTASNNEFKSWWNEHKKDEAIFADVISKSMPTWVCREMNWEDLELPAAAAQEFAQKKVELIYPYYDGVDRMGLGVLYFPDGVHPKDARSIEVTLELARTLFLETIQRKVSNTQSRDEVPEEAGEKKNVLNLFSGLFKGKKAG